MEKEYSLIPSQQTMYLMVKYSFHKQITQIPSSFALQQDIDFNLLTRALNIEIERNDSLRLRFKKADKEIKQYFLDKYEVESVPVLTFKTEEEQEAFFGKDAQKPVKFLKDECFRIFFYNAYNGYKGVYFNVSHLNLDAIGIMVFYTDLLGVYKALKTGSDMPAPLYKYEDYIVKELNNLENKDKLAKDEEFYKEYFLKGGEPIYAGVHGPEFLEKARVKQKNPDLRVPGAYNPLYDKAEVIKKHISHDDSMKILEYCQANNIAPESLFLFGMRTYASAINYRTPDVFMMLLCSKRITFKDKHMGGCLTQPLQLRTIIPEEATFKQGLDEMFSVRTQLYRHLSYPYISARDLSRELFNYGLIQGPACMMFSWIPVPITYFKDVKIDFRGYNLGRYFTPLYTICYPDPTDMGISFNYMYRVKLITPDNIDALHDNAVKIILKGIENPDIAVKELLDSVSTNK